MFGNDLDFLRGLFEILAQFFTMIIDAFRGGGADTTPDADPDGEGEGEGE